MPLFPGCRQAGSGHRAPDGGNPVVLFADAPVGARYGLDLSRVVDITPDDPEHVIMAAWNRNTNDLFRVNVNTGIAPRT